jgi:hypothetical protein
VVLNINKTDTELLKYNRFVSVIVICTFGKKYSPSTEVIVECYET